MLSTVTTGDANICSATHFKSSYQISGFLQVLLWLSQVNTFTCWVNDFLLVQKKKEPDNTISVVLFPWGSAQNKFRNCHSLTSFFRLPHLDFMTWRPERGETSLSRQVYTDKCWSEWGNECTFTIPVFVYLINESHRLLSPVLGSLVPLVFWYQSIHLLETSHQKNYLAAKLLGVMYRESALVNGCF